MMMRRSLLSGLKKIGRNARYNSNAKSDQELQTSYEGIMPRLISLEKLLFEADARSQLKELVGTGVISPEHIISGLKVYTDMQNPLLKKYNFDATDFVIGATEAYSQMHKAMASKNLSNYCNGISTDSTASDLLKESLSPFIFNACTTAQHNLHEQGSTMIMTDIVINRSHLYGVRTKIFDHEKVTKHREKMAMQSQFMNETLKIEKLKDIELAAIEKELNKRENKVDGNNTSIAADLANEHSHVEEKESENINVIHKSTAPSEVRAPLDDHAVEFQQKVNAATLTSLDSTDSVTLDEEYVYREESNWYPDGCVVASVDVMFHATEYYKHVFTNEVGEEVEENPSRVTRTYWTFESCISGQKEMDWYVTDLDGKLGEATGRFIKQPRSVLDEAQIQIEKTSAVIVSTEQPLTVVKQNTDKLVEGEKRRVVEKLQKFVK